MKRKLCSALALAFIIGLSGCSSPSELKAGSFALYLVGEREIAETTTVLNEDGTGFASVELWNAPFKWNVSGKTFNAIPTDSSNNTDNLFKWSDKKNLECYNGYIVLPSSEFDGKIPKGEAFDTTVSFDSNSLHFSKDGTLTVENQHDSKEFAAYTYQRKGDFIITDYSELGSTSYFLVADGTMYQAYYCPVDKLPENL